MLMHSSEQQQISLQADVNYMENYKALEEMKDFEMLKTTKQFALTKKSTVTSKLPSLGSQMADNQASKDLQSENESLKQTIMQLKSRIAETLAKKSELQSESEVFQKQQS